MTENTQNQDKATTAPTQQDVAKSSDAKAEAAATATANVELSEDDLEAVAGGKGVYYGGGSPT
jgi:hypothetical protein